MVKMHFEYQGNLKVKARHDLSGKKLDTAAPLDNNGDGSSFSPVPGTDSVTTVNTLPGAPSVEIPLELGDASNLRVTVILESVDPDDDSILYDYDWYRKPSAGSYSLFGSSRKRNKRFMPEGRRMQNFVRSEFKRELVLF